MYLSTINIYCIEKGQPRAALVRLDDGLLKQDAGREHRTEASEGSRPRLVLASSDGERPRTDEGRRLPHVEIDS